MDTFNLHSTMVLLILKSYPTLNHGNLDLHSTMVLLIRIAIGWVSLIALDLHSTMVLLIRLDENVSVAPNRIYIPLWFYLYERVHRFLFFAFEFTFHYGSTYTPVHFQITVSGLHLHSTMVLLIRYQSVHRQFKIFIYIPLWFYLYDLRKIQRACFIQIYIPLWFYLYSVGCIFALKAN